MRAHIPSDFYLLPSVASMTFLLMLGLGFVLFGVGQKDMSYASTFDVEAEGRSWTGEPRMPRVEPRFRRLRPY